MFHCYLIDLNLKNLKKLIILSNYTFLLYVMSIEYFEMMLWLCLNVMGLLYGLYIFDIWISLITLYAVLMFTFWSAISENIINYVNTGYYIICLLGIIYWAIIPGTVFESILLVGNPALIIMIVQK